MTSQRLTLKAAIGLGLAASVLVPAAASARFNLNPMPSSPAGRDPAHVSNMGTLEIRIEDQIRLVRFGMVPRSALGPSASRIYAAAGLSTVEPDAQAVEEAPSGSLLDGRSG